MKSYEDGYADGYSDGLNESSIERAKRVKELQFKAFIMNTLTYSTEYSKLSEFFEDFEIYGTGEITFIGDVI